MRSLVSDENKDSCHGELRFFLQVRAVANVRRLCNFNSAAELRKSGEEKWIRPDSKTQVTAEHQIVGGAIVPIRVHTIVISVQHSDDISNEDMRAILKEKVIFS